MYTAMYILIKIWLFFEIFGQPFSNSGVVCDFGVEQFGSSFRFDNIGWY